MTKCIKCGRPSSAKCSRCHEHYCSVRCQQDDWSSHKYICKERPILIPIDKPPHNEPILKQTCPTPLLVNTENTKVKPKSTSNQIDRSEGSEENVDATSKTLWLEHHKPPRNIFFEVVVQYVCSDRNIVWVTETKFKDEMLTLLTELNRTKTPMCCMKDINVGALVVAPFEGLNYRAIVEKLDNQLMSASVRFIDYGNKLSVPFWRLHAPSSIMHKLRAYAICVRFAQHIKELEIESVIHIRLLESKDTEDTEEYYQVELKEEDVMAQLATITFDMKLDNKLALPNSLSSQMFKCYTQKDLEAIPFGADGIVKLFVLDSSSMSESYMRRQFTATEYKNMDQMYASLNKVEVHCKSKQQSIRGYYPKASELCLVLHKEKWYRARCMQHLFDYTYLLGLLDYGNEATVTSEDIMPMCEELLFPTYAYTFWVTGVHKKHLNILGEALKSNPIVECQIIEKNLCHDPISFMVRINNIDKLLGIKF